MKQLQELRVQQQQLQTRNVLLEKIAQLSRGQTSQEYLVWQVYAIMACKAIVHAPWNWNLQFIPWAE